MDKKPQKPGERVRTDYVRGGGTSSSVQDQRDAMEAADAVRRREYQDTVKVVAKKDPGAKLWTRKLGGISDNASIVLKVEFRDRTTRGHVICDLLVEEHDGKTEFVLVMICPSCYYGYGGKKRLSAEKSHITLRSYHRGFSLDNRPVSEGGVTGLLWIAPKPNPDGTRDTCTLAGAIHTHETQTCPTCAYKFEIGAPRLDTGELPVSGAVRPA